MMSSSGCGEMIITVLPWIPLNGFEGAGRLWHAAIEMNPTTRTKRTSLRFIESSFGVQRFAEVFPCDQNKFLISQEFSELFALHHIHIVLPPCRAPIRMVPCGPAHLVIVIGEVHDHLV